MRVVKEVVNTQSCVLMRPWKWKSSSQDAANFKTQTETLKTQPLIYYKNSKSWCMCTKKSSTTFPLMSTLACALNYLAVRMGNERRDRGSHLGNAVWGWSTNACHIIINKWGPNHAGKIPRNLSALPLHTESLIWVCGDWVSGWWGSRWERVSNTGGS